MGWYHYIQDVRRIPLKHYTNIKFYTQYTHPMLICRGMHGRTHGRLDGQMDRQTDGRTDGRTDGWTDGQTENVYSIFREKLLLLGEHVFVLCEFVNITNSHNWSRTKEICRLYKFTYMKSYKVIRRVYKFTFANPYWFLLSSLGSPNFSFSEKLRRSID